MIITVAQNCRAIVTADMALALLLAAGEPMAKILFPASTGDRLRTIGSSIVKIWRNTLIHLIYL